MGEMCLYSVCRHNAEFLAQDADLGLRLPHSRHRQMELCWRHLEWPDHRSSRALAARQARPCGVGVSLAVNETLRDEAT